MRKEAEERKRETRWGEEGKKKKKTELEIILLGLLILVGVQPRGR